MLLLQPTCLTSVAALVCDNAPARRLREEHGPFPDLLPSPSGELQLWDSTTPHRGQKVVEGKGREAQNRAGDDIADDRAV